MPLRRSVNFFSTALTERRRKQANQLRRMLKLDMSEWFETTGESYFKHVMKRRRRYDAVIDAAMIHEIPRVTGGLMAREI
ncbi:hypothetical protein EV132_12425 [Rhizobium sullae]|uniref:Uncharacterized protein n=2 Tax=Rhizobium sullae TaxID=50338 RepID=A0A4R3PTJ5_RHISU|nr:hypothetical protein EV132_12425 [Rhizobium sullae]